MSFQLTIFLWSDLVAHTVWQGTRFVDRLNRARVKANKEIGRFVLRNGGLVTRHLDLETDTWRFLRGDGVHLNSVDTDLWFLGLDDGLQRALRV